MIVKRVCLFCGVRAKNLEEHYRAQHRKSENNWRRICDEMESMTPEQQRQVVRDMAPEDVDAFRLWWIHEDEQMLGDVIRAQEIYETVHNATNILLAHGLDTPGRTVEDVLPLLSPEERAVVAESERIYNAMEADEQLRISYG